MSKITRQSSEFHEEIHRIERFHAVDEEIVNIQPQELLDNDHYLRDAISDLEQDLIDHETDVSNPHNVTHAQTGPEGATSGTDTAKDKHVSDADYKRWEDHLHTPGAHGSTRVENSEDNGCILIDGVKTTVYTHPDTHPASMITGLHPSATTGVAGSVAWGNVTGKPSTFPPSSHTHSKSDVGLGNVQNYGIATQAQAEAGTANDVYMTPLRVKEAITALAPLVPLQAVTSDPSNPEVGRIWLRTDLV